MFYKLPPKDGAVVNVGSPLTKTLNYARDGTLMSPGDDARGALDMNAQSRYSDWISACEAATDYSIGQGQWRLSRVLVLASNVTRYPLPHSSQPNLPRDPA